jgi:2-keto-4-pentenoate hydratase/2-oxohepta-3-ene-1,7-dioic acid hydratase in catechol pathway
MRIAAFEFEGETALGVIEGQEVLVLPSDDGQALDLGAALKAGGLEALAAAAARSRVRLPLSILRYRLPLARPGKILCLGLNYADHAKEGGHAPPAYPAIFMRAATSLVAHGAPILRPRQSEQLDYEAELAVVIGKRGRNVERADALGLVAGYACFNDGSVRDYQRRASQWTMGKNFDATGGFGPWLVTPDELPAGAASLRIESRLNGQVMQRDNTANMMVDVPTALALITEVMTLEPGDLVVMGTPAGVGYARNPPVFMRPGDRCEVEIEGIGTLANPIAAAGG